MTNLKKQTVYAFILSTILLSFAVCGDEKIISCPQFYHSSENVLIGINVYNAKSKNDKDKFVLAPDNQTFNKHKYLYVQYWNPDKNNSIELKKFVECQYANVSNNNPVYEIPDSFICRFEFINKPSDKGIITKNSRAKFNCYAESLSNFVTR